MMEKEIEKDLQRNPNDPKKVTTNNLNRSLDKKKT